MLLKKTVSIRFGKYLLLSMNVFQVFGCLVIHLCVLKLVSLSSNVFKFSLSNSLVRLSTMNDSNFC